MTKLGNYTIGAEVDQAQLKKSYEQVVAEVEKTGKISQELLSKMIGTGFEWGIRAAKEAAKDAVAGIKVQIREAQEALKEIRFKWDDPLNEKKALKDIEELKAKLKQAQNTVKDLEKQSETSWNKIGNAFKTAGKWIVAAFAVNKIVDFGKALIKWRDDAVAAEKTFSKMFKSAEKANILMKNLNKFSLDSYSDIQENRENAKQLAAMGIEYEKIIPTMKSLKNVASALNLPLERLALNYGQVRTQGRLTGVDLRDFLRAGVPLIQELAKNLWVSEFEIKKMVSQGKIWFAEVEKAFQTMTSAGGIFANQMAVNGQKIEWQISKLKNYTQIFLTNIAKGIVPPLVSAVEWVNKFFDFEPKSKIQESVDAITKSIEDNLSKQASLQEYMNKTQELYDAGAISTEKYTETMDRLREKEFELQKQQEELNKKQEIAQYLADQLAEANWRFAEKTKNTTLELQKLNQKIDDNETAYRKWEISQKEYLKTQQDLYDKIFSLKENNEKYTKWINDMKFALDLARIAWLDYAEAQEFINTLKIDTEGDRWQLKMLADMAGMTTKQLIDLANAKILAWAKADVLKAEKDLERTKAGKNWWTTLKSTWASIWEWDLFLKTKSGTDAMNRVINKEFENKQRVLKEAQAKLKQEEESFANLLKGNLDASNLFSWKFWWDNDSDAFWWWGSGWSSVDKAKEKARKIKEAKLKELDDYIEKETKRIQESDKDKARKMEQLAQLKEYYDQRKIDIEGKTTEELLKIAEDYQKEQLKNYEDLSKEHQKNMEDARKDIEKYLDKIEEIWKKFEESQEKAKDAIAKIQGELTKLDTDKQLDIAKRGADAKKELEKEEKNLAKLERDQKIWSSDDADKIAESQEKIRKLREEIAFVEANITAEVRAQAEEYQNMSKAQQMHLEYQKQRAKLLEKQEILKAYTRAKDVKDSSAFDIQRNEAGEVVSAKYKWEDGQMKDITNQENINEAIKLEAQQKAYQNEIKELETHLKNKMDEYDKEAQKLQKLRSDNTKNYREELKKRERDLAAFVSNAESLMRRLRASWYKGHSEGGYVGFAEGGYTGMGGKYDVAGVVHKGEWVAPANMVNALGGVFAQLESVRQGMQNIHTPNTIMNKNTTKTQNNTITVNSEFDLRGFLDRANWKF